MRDGRAEPHHVLPESGWASFPIRGDEDVPGAPALFRLSYERATAATSGPAGAAGGPGETG